MQPDSGWELLTRHHLACYSPALPAWLSGHHARAPGIRAPSLVGPAARYPDLPFHQVASWAEVILARSRSPTTMLCSSARRACLGGEALLLGGSLGSGLLDAPARQPVPHGGSRRSGTPAVAWRCDSPHPPRCWRGKTRGMPVRPCVFLCSACRRYKPRQSCRLGGDDLFRMVPGTGPADSDRQPYRLPTTS